MNKFIIISLSMFIAQQNIFIINNKTIEKHIKVDINSIPMQIKSLLSTDPTIDTIVIKGQADYSQQLIEILSKQNPTIKIVME